MLCSAVIGPAILALAGCTPVDALLPPSRFEMLTMPPAAVRDVPPLPDVRLAQIRGARLTRDRTVRLASDAGRLDADFTTRFVPQQQTDDWWATTGAGLLGISLAR